MLSDFWRELLLVIVAFQTGVYFAADLHGAVAFTFKIVAFLCSLLLIVNAVASRPWKRNR